jgi:hypothetical protein
MLLTLLLIAITTVFAMGTVLYLASFETEAEDLAARGIALLLEPGT